MASPIKVAAVVMPGVVTLDLGVILQIFGHAPGLDDQSAAYELSLVTPQPGRVESRDSYSLTIDGDLTAVGECDLVLVPGFRDFAAPPPSNVIDALGAAHERGARVASICIGAFLLGYAGLLDGRRATTHWVAAPRLAELFPKCDVQRDVLYVEDGPVLTCAGLAGGLDLALHIARADLGAARAADLARWNVLAPHRSGNQTQFVPARRTIPDGLLSDTLQWAQEHLSEQLNVHALAHHAHVSPRTLVRRFASELGVTPRRWLTTERVVRARDLLETTALPIEEIARQSGFNSTAALRTQLRAQTSLTPSQYRGGFGEPADAQSRPLEIRAASD